MLAMLPHVNAALNTIATVLLLSGFILIRAKRPDLHRPVMIATIVVSAVFLICYLIYHFTAPVFIYRGPDWSRPAYYTLLISHVILATLVTPMVAVTAWRALRGQFERHRKIARWTWPIWFYVTTSGVAIYVVLYHMFPIPAAA